MTPKDLNAIGTLIDMKLDEKLNPILEKINHLPTKDEFYEEMIKLYKKSDDLEMEKNILVRQVRRQDERIDSLEEIHPGNKHPR